MVTAVLRSDSYDSSQSRPEGRVLPEGGGRAVQIRQGRSRGRDRGHPAQGGVDQKAMRMGPERSTYEAPPQTDEVYFPSA